MTADYILEGCKSRISQIESKTERIKMVYMWVKQNTINLKQFTQLIDYIK